MTANVHWRKKGAPVMPSEKKTVNLLNLNFWTFLYGPNYFTQLPSFTLPRCCQTTCNLISENTQSSTIFILCSYSHSIFFFFFSASHTSSKRALFCIFSSSRADTDTHRLVLRQPAANFWELKKKCVLKQKRGLRMKLRSGRVWGGYVYISDMTKKEDIWGARIIKNCGFCLLGDM